MGVEWVKGMRGNLYAVKRRRLGGGGEEGQLTIQCVHRVLRHAAGKRLEEREVVGMQAKLVLLVSRLLQCVILESLRSALPGLRTRPLEVLHATQLPALLPPEAGEEGGAVLKRVVLLRATRLTPLSP